MRVLRLNEDVTIQNAQAAGVDVSGQYHFLCLSTQPLPKKATEISGKLFCLGRQPWLFRNGFDGVFFMLHCLHM